MENQTPNAATENKSSVGSVIGSIIIIALIILGGLYFWGKRIEESRQQSAMTGADDTSYAAPQNSEAAVIKSMGSSDDLNSIDQDAKNTKVTGLDAELQATTTIK